MNRASGAYLTLSETLQKNNASGQNGVQTVARARCVAGRIRYCRFTEPSTRFPPAEYPSLNVRLKVSSEVAPLSTATATNVTGFPLSRPVPAAVMVWVASLNTSDCVWVDAKFTPALGSENVTSGPP